MPKANQTYQASLPSMGGWWCDRSRKDRAQIV